MAEKENFKRRHFFINKDFQSGLMLPAFLSVVAFMCILSVAIYLVVVSSLNEGKQSTQELLEEIAGSGLIDTESDADSGDDTGGSFLGQLAAQEENRDVLDDTKKNLSRDVLIILALNLIVSLLIVNVMFLFISHRIAGPMFRFRRAFRNVKDRDLSDIIYLRTKDQMKELADEYNDMLKDINRNMKALKVVLENTENKSSDEMLKEALALINTYTFLDEGN